MPEYTDLPLVRLHVTSSWFAPVETYTERCKSRGSSVVRNSTCGREAAQEGRCCWQGQFGVQRFWAPSPARAPGLLRRAGLCSGTGWTLPLGARAQLAQAEQHTSQPKSARPYFSLAEVPAAFRNPKDKVQAKTNKKKKKSRSYLLALFQMSSCSPFTCCSFATIHEKSCLACFNEYTL